MYSIIVNASSAARTSILIILLASVGLSCVTPQTTEESSVTIINPIDNLSVTKELELSVPESKKKSAEKFMIAFVAPSYQEISGDTRSSSAPGMGKGDKEKFNYLRTLVNTMQADLEYILLNKGIRVLGTFPSLDEMTFDQKKRAIYSFIPKVNIHVTSNDQVQRGQVHIEATGTYTVAGNIVMELRESMTGEKLWIKRLESPVAATKPYRFVQKSPPPRGGSLGDALAYAVVAGGIKNIDTTDVALAGAITDFYKELGKKFVDHIDSEEWAKYLEQAESLRKEKRY